MCVGRREITEREKICFCGSEICCMEKKNAVYVDVVLPLPVQGIFTYLLPDEFRKRVQEGSRVVVSFGARKMYTAFVTALRKEPPQGDFEVKEVLDIVDENPILLPSQIRFWQWMADYYLCTIGEVCRAAIPSGLKPESENVVGLNPEYDMGKSLTAREESILAVLSDGREHSVGELQRMLKLKNVLPVLRGLYECGAVRLKEELHGKYKPSVETHVRLTTAFCDEKAMRTMAIMLERSKVQTKLLSVYMRMSDARAAMQLKNASLLREVRRADLLAESGVSAAILTALCKKGVLETYPFEVQRIKNDLPDNLSEKPLNEEQQRAEDEIVEVFSKKSVCLLHGVTGSGKTEVYIHLIRREIERGRQVLYLLPEIALTTQITHRLQRVFGHRLGVYHSKFPDSERVEIWKKQLSESPYDVILGVRSSLFLPFERLGLIIVDEEHETSYKQQDPSPRYHARDAAIMLAAMSGAQVLLGTATPSIESYTNALSGKYGLVEMKKRYGGVSLPEVKVQNVTELRRKKEMDTPFSPELLDEMERALSEKKQVILFKNRRGYASVLECADCGWVPRCAHCDVSLTYHREQRRLECHYCGAVYRLPERCPECGSNKLKELGAGTEKIETLVHELFPEAKVARMDLDTTRSRNSYEQIIESFRSGKTDILIGTQMVSKGLDFDRVRVVGILDADSMLNLPDFRSYERAFQMMSQVAGRAGRKESSGLVILQTRHPDLDVVRQVVENDYTAMYRQQMEERKVFSFPPFCRIINIFVKDRNAQIADAAAGMLSRMLRQSFGDSLLGPQEPVVARVRSLYIRQMVLKVAPALSVGGVRRILIAAGEQVQSKYRSMIYYDVDPL